MPRIIDDERRNSGPKLGARRHHPDAQQALGRTFNRRVPERPVRQEFLAAAMCLYPGGLIREGAGVRGVRIENCLEPPPAFGADISVISAFAEVIQLERI